MNFLTNFLIILIFHSFQAQHSFYLAKLLDPFEQLECGFLTNFYDEFFDEFFDEFLTNFLTNFLMNFLANFLTCNLLTVVSFMIRVPSILFFQTSQKGTKCTKARKQLRAYCPQIYNVAVTNQNLFSPRKELTTNINALDVLRGRLVHIPQPRIKEPHLTF